MLRMAWKSDFVPAGALVTRRSACEPMTGPEKQLTEMFHRVRTVLLDVPRLDDTLLPADELLAGNAASFDAVPIARARESRPRCARTATVAALRAVRF